MDYCGLVMGIKIEVPFQEAHRLLDEWEKKAVQMEGELSDLISSIDSLKAQLNGSLAAPKAEKVNESTPPIKSKKGHNLRVIKSFLESVAQKGATTAEISERVGIGKSSVYVVLTKHAEVFAKGADKLWRLK